MMATHRVISSICSRSPCLVAILFSLTISGVAAQPGWAEGKYPSHAPMTDDYQSTSSTYPSEDDTLIYFDSQVYELIIALIYASLIVWIISLISRGK